MYTEVTRRSSDIPFGPEILNHLTKFQAFILKTDSTPSAYVIHQALSHWGRDKMAAILQAPDDIFKIIFLYEKYCIFKLFTFDWNLFLSKDPINYKPVLVQIMAWFRIDNKP